MSRFFGSELKAGATIKPTVPEGHVLTLKQIAMPANATGKIVVTLTVDGATATVASLDPATGAYQMPMEVSVHSSQKFSLTAKGAGAVHLLGRVEETGDAELDDDDAEDFGAGDEAGPARKAAKKEADGSSDDDYSYGELEDSDLDDEALAGEETDDLDEDIDDSDDGDDDDE